MRSYDFILWDNSANDLHSLFLSVVTVDSLIFCCFYLQYPVYFAFEDEKINAILADVRRSEVAGQPATATTGGSVIPFKIYMQTHLEHMYST